MKRNLVIVRAGDNSLHTNWLGDEAARSWDIIVHYYGDDPSLFRDKGQVRHDAKGPKWPALNKLTQELGAKLDAYDYVWYPDDDLVADPAIAERFFEICHRHTLDLAQPALTLDSIAGHIITLANKSFTLRTTNFVEIMAPCFSRRFLKTCAPTFGANVSGWGLDYLWPSLAPDAAKIGIVDAAAVKHTRARGAQYALVKAEGKTPEQELAELATAHSLSLTKIITGGVDVSGRALSLEKDRKAVIEKIIAGYLPELGNYPQHMFAAIEPLIAP